MRQYTVFFADVSLCRVRSGGVLTACQPVFLREVLIHSVSGFSTDRKAKSVMFALLTGIDGLPSSILSRHLSVLHGICEGSSE